MVTAIGCTMTGGAFKRRGGEGASVLEGPMPWSLDVPESCRMTPAEAAEPDPMAEPIVDVDPNALDEE